jgi:hypothetical protein
MAARLERTLRGAGLTGRDLDAVLEAHDRAGVYRASQLPPDEDDRRWLHPGRNVLILLEDAKVADALWLGRVTGLDQGRPGLMEPRVQRDLRAAGVPALQVGSDPGDWLAEVVALPEPAVAMLLSDALDHLRHLHLDPPGPERDAWVRFAHEAFHPLAVRMGGRYEGGRLERRFRWWCARVAPGLAASPHFDSC